MVIEFERRRDHAVEERLAVEARYELELDPGLADVADNDGFGRLWSLVIAANAG